MTKWWYLIADYNHKTKFILKQCFQLFFSQIVDLNLKKPKKTCIKKMFEANTAHYFFKKEIWTGADLCY